MALVRYIGGSREVFIPDAGVTIKRGRSAQVPDGVAGQAPEGDDLGTGLLAQFDTFEPGSADEVDDQDGEG